MVRGTGAKLPSSHAIWRQTVTDKIGPTTPHADAEIGRLARVEAERSRRAGAGERSVSPTRDEATISMEAVQMQRAREAVDRAPEVRPEVVDRVRQEVNSGQYRVDSNQIARRLVDLLG
jgi:flagellar biosynthesis anti-sigma factor FlgM